MQAALVEQLAELRRRDTEISVPVFRRRRIRGRPRPADLPVNLEENSPEVAYPLVDPGDTLAQGSALAVALREATVRRNHRPSALPEANPFPKVEIAWARARDEGLSLRRIGADAVLLQGTAAGRTAGPRHAALSLGIDGVAFTVPVRKDESARVCANRLAGRLSCHYRVEITEDSGGSLLIRLTSHT